MIDSRTLKDLLKKTEPTTLQKLERLLVAAPAAAIHYALYLKAKEELAEMKRELAQLQQCVREVENQLDQLGPAGTGHGGAVHHMTNWMVSLAESYHGLAKALNADQQMLPRVVGYLQGQHQKGGMAALALTMQNHLPPPSGIGQLAASIGGLPPFISK